jgi:hypothetical protein
MTTDSYLNPGYPLLLGESRSSMLLSHRRPSILDPSRGGFCWGRNSQLEIGDDVCNTGSRLWAEIQAIYLIWVTWGGLQPMGEEG